MSKVLFVDLFADLYDLHGVYQLSSCLKQYGIEACYIKERNYKKALGKIAEIKPDLLLYSSFSSAICTYSEFDGIAKKIFKIKSVIGGPGPTFDWKCLDNSSIDAACIGEGELALVEFINNGFQGKKNIFRKGEKPPIEFYPLAELDNLPFPDREVAYRVDAIVRNMPSKQFLSGRGCPYECTYCFNKTFREIFKNHGPTVRKKSVDYLLEEIRLVRKEYPLLNVVFNEDTFILDKKWFLKFSERFPRETEGLSYTCNIRTNLVDETIVKALSESNCIGVNWSIESGDDFLRNNILQRKMSEDQILNTATLLTRYKIPYRIGNVIGLPGENFDQMLKTLELNIRAKPSLGLANIFVPFPGLALTNYAIAKGYYKPQETKKLPKDFFTMSVLDVSPEQNKEIQKLMCLFPIFIKFPKLFRNLSLRNILFHLPVFLLRPLYTVFYAFHMMKLYLEKAPFFFRCQMAKRYIMNSLRW